MNTARLTIRPTIEREDARDTYYEKLAQFSTIPLWTILQDQVSPEPQTKVSPHLWRWAELRPYVLRAGELVDLQEAERRAVVLRNPGLDSPSVTPDARRRDLAHPPW